MSIAPSPNVPTKKMPMKFRMEPEAPVEDEEEFAEEQQSLDKNALCVEILMEGFVQSYVDFFYLTHRPDPNPGESISTALPPVHEVASVTLSLTTFFPHVSDPNEEGVEREIEVPAEEMLFIRDNLTRAESARRHGETTQVYDCYNNLARYFQVRELSIQSAVVRLRNVHVYRM
jgi:hypothetical protein